ncbi:MAG: efflux RND transporter periplasmic adaptor subunit, partial [Moraxellaceae bacterium]|nr:efflux RND transporter periplasmic adaptor subunit [Moraxellaceae bacterium]
EGERVEKGQVLARLGTEALEARVKQAEAVLTSAKVEATLSRALVDRNRKLMEKNYFSEVDFQKGVGEAEAREEAVRAQQALLDIARKAYADASVKAPQAGVVARRYVEPGSNIGMDGRLFDIVDLAEMELALPVPATDIAMVKTGQRVNFTVGGFGNRRFEGRVVRINPVADAGTRAISTYVRVSNPAADLRGGMYARGEIVTGNGVEGLVVPLEALHMDDSGQLWVLVLEKERLVRRNVVSTSRDVRQNQALVSSGLTEGETVIVARLDESAINQPARLAR